MPGVIQPMEQGHENHCQGEISDHQEGHLWLHGHCGINYLIVPLVEINDAAEPIG